VDWKAYPVLRGFAPDLVLSDEDILWLWRSWRQAIEFHGDPGICGEELPKRTSRNDASCRGTHYRGRTAREVRRRLAATAPGGD
jgi:hypothetical protein